MLLSRRLWKFFGACYCSSKCEQKLESPHLRRARSTYPRISTIPQFSQCLLLEGRAREDLLQVIVGKPLIARSPREAADCWAPRYPEEVRDSCDVLCYSLPWLGGTKYSPALEDKTQRGSEGAWARPSASLGKVFVHAVWQRLKSVFTQIQEPLAPRKNEQGCRWVTKPTLLFVINTKADF